MNWDDIRYVLAIARSGTLTETAKKLGINQTTVSRRLDSLEKELGVRLFDKTTKGWIPTDSGHEILADAEQIELLVSNIERKVLGKDAQLTGPLRVTTIDLNAVYDNALFSEFSKHYPQVTLELSVTYTPQNLAKREADIAIRWTDNPPEYLVGRKLGSIHYGLYAHRELIDKYGVDYCQPHYPWLDWDESMGAHVTRRWMQQNLSQPRIVARFDTAVGMLQSVKNGYGVAFIPKVYGDEDPSLSCLLEPGDEFSVEFWILTHPDLRNTARVRAFMNHAVSYYRKRFADDTAVS